MKKKSIFFCFLVLQQSLTLAQNYILKSQNIHQEDNDEYDFFSDDSNLLHLDLVSDKIKKIRNKIYNYGTLLKRTNFYNSIIISMSKYYYRKINRCTDIVEKKKIVKEYREKLSKIKKNRDSQNLLQLIGLEQEFFDIENDQLDLKKKLDQNGYLDATVDVKTNIEGNFVSIDYLVKKNKRYTIKSYKIDESVDDLFKSDDSFIKVGDNYCEKNFIKEKKLIYENLKNAGFVFFKNQYINFFLTKNTNNKTLDVNVKFLTEDENNLKSFKFDTINVKIEDGNHEEGKSFLFGDINFINTRNFKKSVIYKKIPFEKGKLYTLSQENLLYKKILQTEIFNNVYVTYELDNEQRLFSTIHLYPEKKIKTFVDMGLKKRFQNDYEIIIPYIKQNLSILNFFKLLETINFSISFWGNTGWDKGLILAPEIKSELSIIFPYFFPILPKKENGDFNVVTEVNLKYTNIFKERAFLHYFVKEKKILLSSMKNNIVYNFTYKNQNLDFTITPFKFSSYKDANQKFIENFITKTVKLQYCIDFDLDYEKNSSYIEDIVEFGSCKKMLESFSFRDLYLKNILTLKKTFQIRNDWKYASRVVLGTIHIFKNLEDNQHQGIPYDIYFGVGGRSTVRGFDFDTVGPGQSSLYTTKRKGEIMFIFNNEIRKGLGKTFELASFIDFGNTWKINTPHEIEKFSSNLLENFAVGWGVGIRLNFKLLVVSFDLGFPLYYPMEGFTSDNFCFYFGLNYPF